MNGLIFKGGDFEKSIIAQGRRYVEYKKMQENASLFASGLYNCGVKEQDKLIIIAESSIEWLLVDLACIKTGIVTVPMFVNSSSENLKFQFEDCGGKNIIVQDEEYLQKIFEIKKDFKNVFLIEKSQKFPDIKTIDEIIANEKSSANFKEISENEIATIVYTSGTSGKPKGVVLTRKNLATQISDIQNAFSEINCSDRALSILPLAHIFQRTITLFYVSVGVNIYFVNDIQYILTAMQEIKPTLITIVPRVLEKIHTKVITQVKQKPKILQAIILPLLEYSSTNIVKNFVVKFLLNVLFFNKVIAVFGGEMKVVVSGGAKLNEREEIFFTNCGLNILQGYGMTECSPVISSNTNRAKKHFTVGKPFNSVEVKILENGEIGVRGESVFGGYLNHEKRNPQEFFHTGDAGTLDEQGFLFVTGRIKEQFKNANGKYIDPVKIENLLNSYGGIEASCIVAEGRKYTTAIIFTQISEDLVKKIVAHVNKHLDHHAQIQYFHITPEKPTIENGIITPSLKLRRNEVMKKYANEIEKLYSF